jgi:hypothetical protein
MEQTPLNANLDFDVGEGTTEAAKGINNLSNSGIPIRCVHFSFSTTCKLA